MQDAVDRRRRKEGQRPAEMLPRTKQRIASGQRREHDVGLHGQESGEKGRPRPDIVAALARFRVAQKKVQGQQQEEAASHQDVLTGPRHRGGQLAVGHPQNGGAESGRARPRQACRDGLQQRQVREHGEEDPDAVRQGVAAEHGTECQEKRALAEGPPGSLYRRLKQRSEQAVPLVRLIRQVQPDEVVLLEPCQQARPVERQT